MLSIFYASSLIIAAITYAAILAHKAIHNNSRVQYALVYSQTSLKAHHTSRIS